MNILQPLLNPFRKQPKMPAKRVSGRFTPSAPKNGLNRETRRKLEKLSRSHQSLMVFRARRTFVKSVALSLGFSKTKANLLAANPVEGARALKRLAV